MMRIFPRAGVGAAFAAAAAISGAELFTVTVTNLGPQPLAPVFYATSDGSFDIFNRGTAASSAVERMAEEGDTSLLVAMAGAAGSSVMSFGTTTGPFMPTESRSFVVNADMSHRWLSFASMLGATNDAFIGSAVGAADGQIDLFQGGQPLTADFKLSFLNVWDAGTEVNTELMAHIPAFMNLFVGPTEGGLVTQPHEGITGRGDMSPAVYDWYGRDVAHVTIVPVPEPASVAALGLGAMALLLRRRGEKRN